ncbi:MAG: FAD-binding oxidoreductase, partial [Planctomycetia bacterium]|nr:FAD-binding oxidoreductase [Planctomycetia bacterium]
MTTRTLTLEQATVEHLSCTIDDFGPIPVQRPATVAELRAAVRGAASAGQAVYPLGARTMLHVGLPPTRSGLGVDLRALDQVIDYPARDMTITVQAGITMAKLQAILQQEKQQLPIDVPAPEHATLGGALAANVSGPRRYGYGTLRDYVIGISVVNDQGEEAKAGGRVVKNVAGYDLCKLLIGSFGTLGVITQVTLKLKPLAEAEALVDIPCTVGQLAAVLDLLHGSRTRPVSITAINGRIGPDEAGSLSLNYGGWSVLAGFAGSQTAVAWQVRQLLEELRAAGLKDSSANLSPVTAQVHQALTDVAWSPYPGLTFKANLPASRSADFLRAVEPLDLCLHAYAGNGIVIGHLNGARTLDDVQGVLRKVQELAAGGNVVVLRCPAEWKRSLPIWGAPRGDAWLMRAV